MNWAHENPDRNFSADTSDESKRTSLRDLLKTSEVADYFDEMARMRIGRTISRVVLNPRKPSQ
jgi:hypothetical protein